MTTLAGHGKDPRLVQAELPIVPKVGDRVKDADGFIGVVSLISNKCINVTGNNSIKSWNLEEKCLPTLTILAESEHSPLLPKTLKKSQQLPTSTSAKTRKKSIKPTSLKSQSIPISEGISHQKESISLQAASPVLEPAPRVQKQGSITKNPSSGLNISGASKKDDPNLQLSKTQRAYSIAEWEQSCKAYPKAGICVSGKLLVLPCLEAPKKGKEFLSLPTLTTGLGTGRNAGATKLEKFLKDKLLLQSTQALNPQMMALIFGFPMDWTECLLESPKELEVETTLEPYLEEQSISTARSSHSNEFSTLTEFSANNIDAKSDSPLERLAYLQSERDRLIAMGASPQGIWIEKSKPANKPFIQAVWKSDKPRPEWGDKKSKYIGEYGKENHISAIAQHKAGQELRKIEREIKKLQTKS